jgi:predicted nucleic acid-binding protein
MITYLMGAFNSVTIVSKAATYPPTDADDEIFLLCAINGSANFLVSEDHALVNLKSQYSDFVIGRSADLLRSLGA